MSNLNQNRGFSLLETLLYVALLSVMIVSISSFYSLLIRERARNNTISEVEQQGQFIIDNISQSIRNSESVSSPTPQASATTLNLAMSNGAINPTLFVLSGQNITIQEGSGPIINLNGSKVDVTGLTFTNMTRAGTPGNIKINLTLRHKNPGARYEFDYTKVFSTSASVRQ